MKTNLERYKTAEGRAKAFEKFCNIHDKCGCTECPLSNIKPDCGDSRGQFHWLDLEAEEEKILPCPCCGGECVVISHSEGHCVRCQERYCYIGKNFESKDEAIANHNRIARAVMEADKKGVAE